MSAKTEHYRLCIDRCWNVLNCTGVPNKVASLCTLMGDSSDARLRECKCKISFSDPVSALERLNDPSHYLTVQQPADNKERSLLFWKVFSCLCVCVFVCVCACERGACNI